MLIERLARLAMPQPLLSPVVVASDEALRHTGQATEDYLYRPHAIIIHSLDPPGMPHLMEELCLVILHPRIEKMLEVLRANLEIKFANLPGSVQFRTLSELCVHGVIIQAAAAFFHLTGGLSG